MVFLLFSYWSPEPTYSCFQEDWICRQHPISTPSSQAQVHSVSIPNLWKGETWICNSFLCSGFHRNEIQLHSKKRNYGLLREVPDMCDQSSTAPCSKPEQLSVDVLSLPISKTNSQDFTCPVSFFLRIPKSSFTAARMHIICHYSFAVILDLLHRDQGKLMMYLQALMMLWSFYCWFKYTKHSDKSTSLCGPSAVYTNSIHQKEPGSVSDNIGQK